MSRRMTDEERRAFLMHGTRTGKLATVRADGRPHVAPIWFVLDGDDLVFNTGATTVKGRNLRRDPRASIVVDDETPPFSYVRVDGVCRGQRRPGRDARVGHPHRRALHGRRAAPRSSAAATRCRASCWCGSSRPAFAPRRGVAD